MINHMKRKSFYIGLSKCVVAVSSLLLLLVIASPSIPAAFKKVAMGEAPPAFTLRGP